MSTLKLYYLLFFCFLTLVLTAQKSNKIVLSALATSNSLVKSGHILEAATGLSQLLKSGDQFTPIEKLAINNNLGILHKNMGQYDISLEYYDIAESIYINNNLPDKTLLINIYGNKANIYSDQGDYPKALEYCEKAIRTFSEGLGQDLRMQQPASSLYLNAGIIYTQLGRFSEAISSLDKCILLKKKYNFQGIDMAYFNLAKVYSKTGNIKLADEYYNQSIRKSIESGTNSSVNLAQIYLEYGNFLISQNEKTKAFALIIKAINFNLSSFGEKNQLTSNCFQLMGDYYRNIYDLPNALAYYQKALISGSKDFNNQDFATNPSLPEITANLWQLRVLQLKADVLVNLADKENDKVKKINFLNLSLNTINLAIEMTNKIRLDYQDGETRLIFTEKQKNVFAESIDTAIKLYNLTSEKRFLDLAYQNCQQSKANELKYEIARNKSFSNKEVPDSLRKKEREIQNGLRVFTALIKAESELSNPDTTKLTYWKDQQFNLKRALEKNLETIEKEFPRFIDVLKRGNIVDLQTVQANLEPDFSLIDYLFSEADEKGDRKLYEFVVTPKNLVCHIELVDHTLTTELSGLKDQLVNQAGDSSGIDGYNTINQRLYKAYAFLIQPLEKYFVGKQLVIIPDEDLSYLPFDAFLTKWTPKKEINYAELDYLISDYSISYGYSTNTQWNNQVQADYWPNVIGFAPDYSNAELFGGLGYNSIKRNDTEIRSIMDNFSGSFLRGTQASIDNFTRHLDIGAIIHLAMHAEMDIKVAGSSNLVFSPDKKVKDNFRLPNYEIGQMSIKSPMVVLSACNSGNGKLYNGEGLMSLARSFILAGVPSVVETLWPVEDIPGSKIMGSFYRYLSQGKPKNTAMRLAKMDYINSTSPSFVDPRFWSAYSVMGDVSPVKRIWWKEPPSILVLAIVISVIFLIGVLGYYLFRVLRIS